MGILDNLEDPGVAFGMGLLDAGGPSMMPVSLGQALGAGYKNALSSRDRMTRNQLMQAQAAMQNMQLQEMQRKMKEDEAIRALAQRHMKQPSQGILGYGTSLGGQQAAQLGQSMTGDNEFDAANLAAINSGLEYSNKGSQVPISAPSEGGLDLKGYVRDLAGIDPMKAIALQQSMSKEGYTLKPGETRYTADNRQISTNPDKPTIHNGYIVSDGKGGFMIDPRLFAAERNLRATGATRVNVPVSLGQKGFDNTLKLRGDFRSEPIYKAHQEVKSAYSQISTALKKNSPAGDLAGATKIMKLLDPGSVVRESELGMAMAASGALDRLSNYADMTMRGTKLTPTQRKDFQNLADSLYRESARQYNDKRGEYKGIAQRNELNVSDVLGEEDKLDDPLGIR